MNRFQSTIKRYGIVLLLSTSVFAEQAAEPTIARLFTTAVERNDLDQLRERFLQGLENSGDTRSLGQLVAPGVKFNGLVMRRDGKGEVWINGKSSLQDDELGRELRSKAVASKNATVHISLPDGEAIKLRPGQIYYPSSKVVKEGYQAPELSMGSTASDEINPAHADVETAPNNKKNQKDPNSLKKEATAEAATFDEAKLAEQVSKIQLLESRIDELEKAQEATIIQR